MTLDRDFTLELKTYHEHEEELQQHLHKHVVIVADQIVGIYETYEQAVMSTVPVYGLERIFVHEITPPGQPALITRLLFSA
ncbi:hypothetical protein GC173_12935 [bacterium]|nr:hypothetical protein [bacterium]